MNSGKEVSTDFDKVSVAARSAMRSVIETARRTNTPIILMRDGRIAHLSPDEALLSKSKEESH